MKKTFYKDEQGNIHFGVNPPQGYKNCQKEDILKTLENPEGKKFWRCNVCNDLQISLLPLEQCPTCFVNDAYFEIEKDEFIKLLEVL